MAATPPARPQRSSDELLGELAEEASRLVRGELELAVARRGPELRRVGLELAAALPALVAAALALAALTWAAGAGLARVIPGYGAALVLAAAWGIVALALVQLDHPRRLLQRLLSETGGDAVARAERERGDAEQALRLTAERLGRALTREAAERELTAPIQGAEELIGVAGREGSDVVKELLVALLAPGRAGLSALEALMGLRDRPGAPPRRRRLAPAGRGPPKLRSEALERRPGRPRRRTRVAPERGEAAQAGEQLLERELGERGDE